MYPRSVSEIYQDFAQRRSGLLRALTDGERAHRRGGFSPLKWGGRAPCPHCRAQPKQSHLFVADVEDLYQQCDPNRDNLCLYGEWAACESRGDWAHMRALHRSRVL